MAQKNDLKPNYSSSSEEEEEEEEEATGTEDEQTSGSETDEVSDSDSGEKSQKKEPKKTLISPSPQPAMKPQGPTVVYSSETEESGSETDSDTPVKGRVVADPNIKPISSKPMEREGGANVEVKLVKKSGSKTSSTPPPAKTKRPPPTPPASTEKDAKKAKNTAATDEDSKKQLFQRLWSEDDEIVILKGMIDYKTEKNGENPVNDMGAFHEFIKKSLHVDVSRAQLVDKVRRLKKKYVNNASREKNGKDRSFSKSHEQKGYELSKLIWGSNSDNTGNESKKKQKQKNGNAASSPAVTVPKSNGVDDKDVSVMEVEKKIDIARFVQYGRNNDGPILQEEIFKAGVEMATGSEREELEERLKDLRKQELELFVKRMDLMKEQAVRVLEAINSSGS